MGHHRLDNGEYLMRRPPWTLGDPWPTQEEINRRRSAAVTSGERPQPEDTTGLKMLEEFLAKRKGERDGDERK